jgi:enoyl-CoA hydratase
MTRLKAQDQPRRHSHFSIHSDKSYAILKLLSEDQTNRLTLARIGALIEAVENLAKVSPPSPLILAGNENFFSAGADLNEIARLSGAEALEFARIGQQLMSAVEHFPAPTVAAVRGYCMGGGLDLALACRYRIAAPNAVFGHRGALLGLITGWGGTQRLTRLVGRARALHIFTTATRMDAQHALRIGLIAQIHENPLKAAVEAASRLARMSNQNLSQCEAPAQHMRR